MNSGNDTGEMGEKAKWLSTTYKEKDLNLDYGQRPVAAKLRFDWNVNVEDQKRAAKIAFKFTDNDGNPQETVVTVSKSSSYHYGQPCRRLIGTADYQRTSECDVALGW